MTAPTVVNVTRHRAQIPSSSSSSSPSASDGQHPPVPSQDDRTTLTHEALKTSLEQAKLERRRYEHAMLRDALRRGTPYSYLPGLLARSSTEGAQQPPDRHSPETIITSPHTVSPVRWTSGVVRPQTGAIYMTHFVASPVGGGNAPAGRRLNLDDSFLRRAYKRRRSWGTGRGKHRRGQSSGEISFHHWVPGNSGEERRV